MRTPRPIDTRAGARRVWRSPGTPFRRRAHRGRWRFGPVQLRALILAMLLGLLAWGMMIG